MTPHDCYSSFLLQVQLDDHASQPVWLVSIQSTRTGERRFFSSMEAFFQFLRNEYRQDPNEPELRAADQEKTDPNTGSESSHGAR